MTGRMPLGEGRIILEYRWLQDRRGVRVRYIWAKKLIHVNTSLDSKTWWPPREWKRRWIGSNKLNHGIHRSRAFLGIAKESHTWWQHTQDQRQVKECIKESLRKLTADLVNKAVKSSNLYSVCKKDTVN